MKIGESQFFAGNLREDQPVTCQGFSRPLGTQKSLAWKPALKRRAIFDSSLRDSFQGGDEFCKRAISA